MKALRIDGITYINTTPHELRLVWSGGEDAEPVLLPPCGVLLNATPQTKTVRFVEKAGSPTLTLQSTSFEPDDAGDDFLNDMAEKHHATTCVVLCSAIAAQAYADWNSAHFIVAGVVPARGYERVGNDQKRVYADVFNIIEG